MKTKIWMFLALALASAGLSFAQQAAPAAGASPVAKQPKPKSQKEVEALQAMFGAQDADGRLTASKNLLTKFADTEFKSLAYTMMAMAYQQKNDTENMIAACEEVLKIDAKNFNAMIMIASALAQRTREFDLDKEEKLARAEKLATDAQAAIIAAPRPNPNVTDEQWNAAKKDYNSQALEALGLAALARKKNDVAIAKLKESVETSSQPEPATMVRLASVYNLDNKPDAALAVLDKVMAIADLHPTIRQVAQAEKVRATQIKGAAKPAAPAPPPAAPKP